MRKKMKRCKKYHFEIEKGVRQKKIQICCRQKLQPARKQCTTTLQAIGKATRPSQEATRYPEGGTSKTKNLLGQGATRKQPRGGGREAATKPQTDKGRQTEHRDDTCRAETHTQARKDRQRRHTKTDPSIFFRPTPSWLPPGRSTCLKACCNGINY